MPNVVFRFENGEQVSVSTSVGENLLETARKSNVVIDAPCSGNGSCGKCKVKFLNGVLDSKKTRHISDSEYEEGWRLACVSTVTGDVEVMVPDIASAFRSRMKVADLSSPQEVAIFEEAKSGLLEAGLTMENNMEIVHITMAEPTLDDTMPDIERLEWALQEATGMEQIEIPYSCIRKMPDVLRAHQFDVQCVIAKMPKQVYVYDIFGGSEEVTACGLAIDIGTTSVTGVLVNMLDGKILAKASTGNGQIRYGADVINRIIESTKDGGQKRLQDAIVEDTLNPMIQNMCRSAKIKNTQVYRMAIAGNTTMNHLLLGINADPLRMEPYIPAFFKCNSFYAANIGLKVNPEAHIIMAPNIGSYVGGDITAGTLITRLWDQPEFSLFIDLGTNGELVFGNSDFMMSCACSAGPAFEGGDISCGMRATDGAIEACSIDKETMEPTLTIVGDEGTKPVGICGSGIIDIISELFRCGIISPKGKFIREGERIKHDAYGMGSYVLAFEEQSGTVKDVEITEVDIDNFIRAKGAIFSAIRTMLTSLDFDISMIEKVYVAGGIGSGINMQNAINIGMFPDIPVECYQYIGNSSLSGAYAMLLSTKAERKTYDLARNMTYLELSTEPGYMDEFVACCFLPHTDSSLFPSVEC